jgi:hypothetical protein
LAIEDRRSEAEYAVEEQVDPEATPEFAAEVVEAAADAPSAADDNGGEA